MKKIFIGFVVGAAAGVWGHWYFEQAQNREKVRAASNAVITNSENITSAIREKANDVWVEDIKREVEHSGVVIREKARQAGSAISDATANARLTAAIKAKLLAEPGVSSMSINVDSSDGLVTLSGTVSSHEQIAKAVKLAMDTDGVQKVISTLQVKPK